MKQFPSNIQFKYPWRKYQDRVLSELEDHLEDNHLHVIAPPGSGKTVLGLEVALRLDKPTLILAPTIAIRNQWITRFCELFLQTNNTPDWISRDIKQPTFLTVSTYQGLHMAVTGSTKKEEEIEGADEDIDEELFEEDHIAKEEKKIIKQLAAINIGTIVVDEAHHLKNEWWKSLTKVKRSLNATIVGLTATPPYDVSYAEWQRYLELNGPVDAEISVPELIAEGNLCPHQDFVVFSEPTQDELDKILAYRERIDRVCEAVKADQKLISAVEQHPIFSYPLQNLEWIYSNLECYSATLIFLQAVGKKILKKHIGVIGVDNYVIPELSYDWLEVLLTFYLYKAPESFKDSEEHQEKLLNKLKRAGAIEKRKINLLVNHKMNRFLSSSISKLNSIEKIVDFEYTHLKDQLHMVILTDYIRKEFLVNESVNSMELNKIGVLPIFEKLRRNKNQNIHFGILSGSLVIIPKSALEKFTVICHDYGISSVKTEVLPYDPEYLIIKTTEQLKHDIVHIVTQTFEEGYIQCLIGTKSLLGEGWDAPSINSLILASFVGSYVLSNQMRGRAIRTDIENKAKTGQIWHLACVDTTAMDGGNDLQLLKRRFHSFVGLSFTDDNIIQNSIQRIDIPKILNKDTITAFNEKMFSRATERDQLQRKWVNAIENGSILIEEVMIPFPEDKNYQEVKTLVYRKTIQYFVAMLMSGIVMYLIEVLDVLANVLRTNDSKDTITFILIAALILGVLFFGRGGVKYLSLYIKYRDISKDVHNIGMALVESLIHIGSIKTRRSDLIVVSEIDTRGVIYCHLEGGTTFEKSTFIKSLQEVINEVDNPRYLIIRKSKLLGLISQKDFHSVPEDLARNKKDAQFFYQHWIKRVGNAQLIYTRTIDGRKLLLKSRLNSLATKLEDRSSQRVNKWV